MKNFPEITQRDISYILLRSDPVFDMGLCVRPGVPNRIVKLVEQWCDNGPYPGNFTVVASIEWVYNEDTRVYHRPAITDVLDPGYDNQTLDGDPIDYLIHCCQDPGIARTLTTIRCDGNGKPIR